MRGSTRFTIVLAATATAVFILGSVQPGSNAQAQRTRKPASPGGAVAQTGAAPFRAPAGRAPQAELDAALYSVEPFFDVNARLPRPYADARTRVAALATKFPTDPAIPLRMAWLDEKTGQFDTATTEMEQFATLAGRQPNALRRLAWYYRNRGDAAGEVKTLDELAAKLPAAEQSPVLRRAIAATNDGKPAGVAVEGFYDRLIDAEPDDGNALREYVSLLLASNDSGRALKAIDRVARANESGDIVAMQLVMSERARVYDRLGQRQSALDVYERTFDPLWPRAIVADYYALLTRYGQYRAKRRALQDEVGRGTASLQTVSRLFNIYSYEGNLPASARLLAGYEAQRQTAWTPSDLELAAGLYAQIGDLDQSSRYLYTLFLMGGMNQGSPDRERILARLFTSLVTASSSATRLAPGGISLYKDIARLDARPGALNGLLSLILAGNNPAAEYSLEEARAGGYLNRALAHTIYDQFTREFPSSPRLGAMTVNLLEAYADLGADKDLVAIGADFLARHPESRDYEFVALSVADAQARLKNRAGERAVLATLLDRTASAQPPNRPLLPRNSSRWLYEPEQVRSFAPYEDVTDNPPDVFMTPNGTPLQNATPYRFSTAQDENTFDYEDDSGKYEIYEPTDDSSGAPYSYDSTPDDYRNQPETIRKKPSYSQVLESIISSYASDKLNNDALQFFWSELNKHPRDEGLHERFLKWLGGTSLVNEQLKAYKLALNRYDDGTWLHRFARWYVRRGRAVEVRRLTQQVISTLDDDDVTAYMQNFAGYGGSPSTDALDWDNQIELQVTRVALARFPNNTTFVKMLLARLAEAEAWPEWERVSREHYFADPDIRSALLSRLSQTGRLDQSYATAKQRLAGGLDQGPSSAFAYAVFAADSARWLSHFDEAIAAYQKLVALYPGERAYAEPLAALLRSFGSSDDANYLKAAQVYDSLASVYPTDHKYATQAGEVLAEAGDMGEAAKRWQSLIASSPGSPAVRLEVATIFWDYYQFEDAGRELETVRQQTGDKTLYAFRLGAIYDNQKDFARAIPEYVRTLSEPGDERNRAALRLAELSQRDGMLARIASAYEAERAASADNWRLTLGYADFLNILERRGEAVGVLNKEVGRSSNMAFLEEARDRFRQWKSPESEVKTLERLVASSQDERERIRTNLQLASLLEEQGATDRAAQLFEKLVADNSTNAGVLDEAAKFFWRVGKTDRSAQLSRDVISRAQGDYRRQFTVDLARRQADAGKLSDAEATLRGYFNDNPLDMDVFNQLTDVLGAAKKTDALAAHYSEGLKRIREAKLGDDEEVAKIAELRNGMIGTLTTLGRTTEAIDQYIELINRDAESQEVLDSAYDYAARYQLTPRLLGYYEKLAKDSFKDYRWSLVLGRLQDRQGDPGAAAESFRRAVVNEPQRIDLRESLADTLERANRLDDAIVELRRAWELDGRDPKWLINVASIQAKQGKYDDAAKTVDEAIASRAKTGPSRIFYYAGQMAEWSMLDQSAALYDRAIELSMKNIPEADLSSANFGEYVRLIMRTRSTPEVFARLEGLNNRYLQLAATKNNFDASKAKQLAANVVTAERDVFAPLITEYSSPREREALDAAIRSAAVAVNGTDEKRRYLGMAQIAGLAVAQEMILQSIVDRELADQVKDKTSGYRNALNELTELYAHRGQFSKAAEQLAAYKARDQFRGDYDYDRRIANYYYDAGDTAREIEALERIYASAAGATATSDSEQSQSMRRLFTLLYAQNDRSKLVDLAGKSSPYQLVLVNFLIERGDEELARRAVANAKFSPAWVKAQTAEIGLYFRNSSANVDTAFRDVLRVKTIGELVTTPFDANQALTGGDYFLTARNYGLWLDLVANKPDQARDYIVGRVEDRPQDGSAQAMLGRYYLVRQNTQMALTHTGLAMELSPGASDVLAIRGEALYAAGRREEAVQLWAKLLEGDDRTSSDYSLYFQEMSSHSMFEAALVRLRPLVAGRVYKGQVSAVSELFATMSAYAAEHPDTWSSIVDLYYGAAIDAPEDILLARMVLTDQLVPMERQSQFYRLLTERLASQASAYERDNRYGGYSIGDDDYVTPVTELNTWRQKAADFYISQKSFEEASRLLSSIESERLDLKATLRDEESDFDYSWVDLAKATVAVKTGRAQDAVVLLGRYIKSEPVDGVALPDLERVKTAVAVLRSNGATAQADAMLEDVYRTYIGAGYYDVANYTGLAEVLYRTQREAEADALLRAMLARRGDDRSAIDTAAAGATRAGRFALAVEFREKLARLSRTDSVNLLELARLRAVVGREQEAIAPLLDIIGDERAMNTTRARAVDVVLEISSRNPASASAATARLTSPTSEPERVLAAMLKAQRGDAASARADLEAVLAEGPSTLAAIELGRLNLSTGQNAQALAAFERALMWDSNDRLASTIAFGGPTPINSLVRLYIDAGRSATALRVAEQHANDFQVDPDATANLIFQPEVAEITGPEGLPSLATLSQRSERMLRGEALGALADAAAKVQRWDEAVGYATKRAALLAPNSPERAQADAVTERLSVARYEANRSTYGALRIGAAVASEQVTIREFTLD